MCTDSYSVEISNESLGRWMKSSRWIGVWEYADAEIAKASTNVGFIYDLIILMAVALQV